jgi:hypothetical protein
MKPKKSERAAAEPKYRANARERAVIEKHFRRMAEAAPRLKAVSGNWATSKRSRDCRTDRAAASAQRSRQTGSRPESSGV